MNRHWAAIAAAILAITLLGFFQFPGHTILQSDTQIYLPILERAQDPSLYTKDVMAVYPHVSFTLYDETTLLLRQLTGARIERILQTQQFIYRALGILGLYLIGLALGLLPWQSIFVAAVVSLGATINGPAVLSVEYEPVPRGFALPFLLLSMGLAGHMRWTFAALCAGIAFGFHPPTALAYSALLFGILIWQKQQRAIALLAIAPLLLLATLPSANSSGLPLFGTIAPELEALQRMRAAYNWVSIWITAWAGHYALLFTVCGIALFRIRRHVPAPLLPIFASLPLIGVFSVPTSYLLLERAKLSLIPQFQPGRYLLFVTLFAVILCSAAAMHAVRDQRWLEAGLFLVIPFAVPMNPNLVDSLTEPKAFILAATLAMTSLLSRRLAWIPAVAAFFVIPYVTQVKNFASLHHVEIDQLAQWARTSTPKDALSNLPTWPI
ncbi:MAG: hypothetical protein WKF37_19780 [Bryobacteraceae bacterium]